MTCVRCVQPIPARDHQARGLCASCYWWAHSRDRLGNFPRRTWPRAELMAEWEFMADPSRPLRAEAVRLAPAFGMTAEGLRKAVTRARAA